MVGHLKLCTHFSEVVEHAICVCEMIAKLFQIMSIAMFLHVFLSSYKYLIHCLKWRFLMKILDLDLWLWLLKWLSHTQLSPWILALKLYRSGRWAWTTTLRFNSTLFHHCSMSHVLILTLIFCLFLISCLTSCRQFLATPIAAVVYAASLVNHIKE